MVETIIQTPFVTAVVKHFEGYGEVTGADVAGILQEFCSETHNAHEVLEIVGRWFTYFLQDPLETVKDTVKLIKARYLGLASVQRETSAALD